MYQFHLCISLAVQPPRQKGFDIIISIRVVFIPFTTLQIKQHPNGEEKFLTS